MAWTSSPRVQHVAALVAAVSGVLAVAVSYLAIRQAEDIATRSGAFDKATIETSLGTCHFDQRAPTDVVFGSSFDKDTVYVFALPLVLKNSGVQTIGRVSLTLRYPTVGRFAIPTDLLRLDSTGDVGATAVDRTVSTLGQHDYVSFNLRNLDPGKQIGLKELVHFTESRVEGSLTEGGATWSYSADFAFEASLSVSGSDLPTTDYPLRLSGVAATSMRELKDGFVRRLRAEGSRLRKQLPLWRYALSIPGQPTRTAVLILPTLREDLRTPSRLVSSTGEDISCVQYQLATWRQLL